MRKKLIKSECGRPGAIALNSDPDKKSAAAKKSAATRKAKNPDAFIEMGKKGGKKSRVKPKDANT